MRRASIDCKFVEYIPEILDEGVLYISKSYATAAHKCFCGCGSEVVTPLNPTGWKLWVNRNLVSLDPSIGNWSLACRSHYWIRRSKIIWAGDMSQREIARGRSMDAAIRKAYFENLNRDKTSCNNFLSRAWGFIKGWLSC